jgi:4-hydroxybenzoate polyprenyltransferase
MNKRMSLRTALRLGRVSNLPTVWTNVLAGVALNGGEPTAAMVIPVALAASLFYVAGMFLNDAFDHRWDAQHRPERPIPAGEVSADSVFTIGFGLMAAALLLLAIGPGHPVRAGLVLAICIVIYDASHKTNPMAPVVMGLCRVSVYLLGALAVSAHISAAVYVGAVVLLAYLVGLTALARQETRRPGVGAIVGALIAGICLLDALMLAVTGHLFAAALAAAAFPLTRRLQRQVPGT